MNLYRTAGGDPKSAPRPNGEGSGDAEAEPSRLHGDEGDDRHDARRGEDEQAGARPFTRRRRRPMDDDGPASGVPAWPADGSAGHRRHHALFEAGLYSCSPREEAEDDPADETHWGDNFDAAAARVAALLWPHAVGGEAAGAP